MNVLSVSYWRQTRPERFFFEIVNIFEFFLFMLHTKIPNVAATFSTNSNSFWVNTFYSQLKNIWEVNIVDAVTFSVIHLSRLASDFHYIPRDVDFKNTVVLISVLMLISLFVGWNSPYLLLMSRKRILNYFSVYCWYGKPRLDAVTFRLGTRHHSNDVIDPERPGFMFDMLYDIHNRHPLNKCPRAYSFSFLLLFLHEEKKVDGYKRYFRSFVRLSVYFF